MPGHIRQLTDEEIAGAIAILERLQEGYIKYESEKPEREVAARILVGALDVAITVMKQEVKSDEQHTERKPFASS